MITLQDLIDQGILIQGDNIVVRSWMDDDHYKVYGEFTNCLNECDLKEDFTDKEILNIFAENNTLYIELKGEEND